jgi:hypothetical protein
MWKEIRSVNVNDESGRKESMKNMERGHGLFEGPTDMTQQDCRDEIYEDSRNYPYLILMRTECK